MSIIGDNIQRLRKLRGLTQEELAKLMGYKSKSTINKIELGVNDIPQSKIAKFAEVLGTTPAEIMGWSIPESTGTVNMFWQRFYVLCKQANSTPNVIAKKLSISSGSVTAWKGGRIPNSTTLQAIADYFGVSTDYLLGKENPPQPFLSDKEAELVRRMQELDDAQAQQLLEYMEFLIQQRKKKGGE